MRVRSLLLWIVLLALPGPGFASAWIAIVVPARQPAPELGPDDLPLVYRSRKLYSDDGRRIQPVNLPADSAVRRRFSHAVLHASPESMEDYWNQLYFQGVLPPYVVASEEAVLRFVSSTPQAVGYLDACAADDSVRVLLLIDPDSKLVAPGAALDCPARTP